jgi:N-acetylglutamate synthase-like GNAT family acetyltransferase
MDVSDLYRALEFSHYAERYRDNVLAVAISLNTPFRDLVLDFKVLATYGIKVVVCAPDPKFELEREIALSNTHGTNFSLIQAQEPTSVGSYDLKVNLTQIEAALALGQMPVVVYHCLTPQTSQVEAAQKLGNYVCTGLNAKKIIFLSQQAQMLEDALSKTRVTYDELDNFYDRLHELNMGGFEGSIRFVQSLLEANIPEIAFLVGKPGVLCQEVFTHEGAGILFSNIAHSEIRQAELHDISDITFQIRPQIESGRILPVEENSIAQNLHNFWVYEIDGQIVSVMQLKEYGDWVEIATGSTIFRDRKYGRASKLFMHIFKEAKRRGVKGIFGVGINPKLEQKLTPLGFTEVQHSELPQAWQDQYDSSRPSRAFAFTL